jgi:hypothetical protein
MVLYLQADHGDTAAIALYESLAPRRSPSFRDTHRTPEVIAEEENRSSMRYIHALAVILTAVSLIPGGAHVAELINKLSLGREEYFMVQQIYRDWAFFGAIIIAAFIANLAVTILLWRRRASFWLPGIACLCIAASLAVFFIWVYPTNLATRDWTDIPANWDELRTRWEFGHLAGAGLIFVALCLTTVARR